MKLSEAKETKNNVSYKNEAFEVEIILYKRKEKLWLEMLQIETLT